MSRSTRQSLLSSPDPLNDSPTFSSPVKSQAGRTRKSFPFQGSSPRKQMFQLDVGDRLSPQKIRVTVEAEHPDGHINNEQSFTGTRAIPSPISYRVPTVRQGVRTTTTTIPVKGLSDSEDDSEPASEKPARRGRPRKSVGTPVPTKSRNRALTPKANQSSRRRRTFGDLVDGDDSEDWDFAIGAGVELSRGKGRSRSRSAKGSARDKSTPAAKQTSSPDKTVSSVASRKGRGRRKTLTPVEIIIHEDDVHITSNHVLSEEEGAMFNGVLVRRDANLFSAVSATLTDERPTSFEENDPKLLPLQSSPAKKTPQKAVRSSLKLGSADIKSLTGLVEDGSIDNAKVPANSTSPPIVTYQLEKLKDHERSRCDERIVDEIQEFDTVLESEGFSMISVESVPSLREHISSPPGPSQNSLDRQETTHVSDALSLNANADGYLEDSFSSIAPEILEAATPKRKPSNSMLRAVLSSKIPIDEDSFSSIPPEILEAATPGKHGLTSKSLSLKVQESKLIDNSFSSNPPAILEAATPAKFTKTEATWSGIQAKPNSQSKPVSVLATTSSLPVLETGKQSLVSSGLLTPDETPSPTDIAGQQPSQCDDSESKVPDQPTPGPYDIPLQENSSIINSKIGSSPPSIAVRRFTYAAVSRQPDLLHDKHLETPSIIFSSPMLPPPIQQLPFARSQMSSKPHINGHPKQSISPAVRAGRVLQDIAVTSTSRSRTQSLGSPFKSPAVQRKTTGTSNDSPTSTQLGYRSQELPEMNNRKSSDLFVGFSNNTKRELRKSMLVGEEFAHGQKRGDIINSVTFSQGEDPFRNNYHYAPSSPQKESSQYILDLPSQPSHMSRSQTGLRLEDQQFQDSLRSESAMSWQAENAVTLPASGVDIGKVGNSGMVKTTELFQQDEEVDWAREMATVNAPTDFANLTKATIIDSSKEKYPVDICGDFEEMEEDIWQAEARESSSVLKEQPQEVPLRQDPTERPRRSKIPSPWRKKSNRLVYSDELAQLSSPHQPDKNDNNLSDAHVKPKTNPTPATVQRRPTHDATEDEDECPESSIVWHIPQKMNFAPRPRSSGNLDLSALLASSPLKLPQRTSTLHSEPDSLTPETRQSSFSESVDLEQGTANSGSNEENSYDHGDGSYLAEDITQGDNGVYFTGASDKQSELVSDSSHGDSRVHYPTLPRTISLSPQKSCLRTTLSDSPSKSVAFALPSPPAPQLSPTTWSKSHWRLIHGIYDRSKLLRSSSSDSNSWNNNDDSSESLVETSKYLGKKIHSRGEMLTLEQWHLNIVREFREEVPGWDEGVIAKRLFAIIVGERLRMEGRA